jgi:hypothetical protein
MRAIPKFQSWNRKKWLCGILVARMGLAFQVSEPDSTATPIEVPASDSVTASREPDQARESRTTRFSFSGGGGTYFREALLTVGQTECGPTSVPLTGKSDFKEIAFAIDHEATKRFHVGVRGGYVWTSNSFAGGYDTTLTGFSQPESFAHLDPYMAVEWKYFGVGLGAVFSGSKLPEGGIEDIPIDDNSDAQVSGHLRVGSLTGLYVNASRWEGVPLLTNGHLMLGGGVRPVRPLELYAGYVTDGPYQNENWLGRVTVDATPNWSLYLTHRFSQDYNGHGDEYGTAVGVTYRKAH